MVIISQAEAFAILEKRFKTNSLGYYEGILNSEGYATFTSGRGPVIYWLARTDTKGGGEHFLTKNPEFGDFRVVNFRIPFEGDIPVSIATWGGASFTLKNEEHGLIYGPFEFRED